jgi:cell division protein ZapA (FtsZ GTPase activity inhibitor)
MKASIFVINTENKVFEFNNTLKCTLNIGRRLNCKFYNENFNDIDVGYIASINTIYECYVLVHKSKSEKESHYIIQYILDKLKEKSDLQMEIQAIKKIKKDAIKPVLEMLKKQLHDDYFELKVSDILNTFQPS